MFYHKIDPVLFELGPLEIRYYGIIYAFGFILTFLFLQYYPKAKAFFKKDEHREHLLFYLIIGVVLCARLFEIIFYNLPFYLEHPLEMLKLWKGGLSFHGGLVGAALALFIFVKKYKYSFLKLADLICIPTAFALFLGRIANFLNGELYGRLTNVPWAVQFPRAEGFRHPSQLYEAAKNLFTGFVLFFYDKKERKDGRIFSLFLILYGILRFSVEFFRESEIILASLTMGQLLSIPVFIVGLWLYQKTK